MQMATPPPDPEKRRREPVDATLLRSPLASLSTSAASNEAPAAPLGFTLTPSQISRLISCRELWDGAFSELTAAITAHPETVRMVKATTAPNQESSSGWSNETDDTKYQRALASARGYLSPYKIFFTQWLRGDEFLKVFTAVWRPLPSELPTQEKTRKQIDLVGGPEFYERVKSMLNLHSPQPPRQEGLLTLVDKVIYFCEWEPKQVSGQSALAHTSQSPQLSLSDLREIREALVTMLVLINNLLPPSNREKSPPLPRL